MQIKHI